MLGQRRIRWANINTAMDRRLVFAGMQLKLNLMQCNTHIVLAVRSTILPMGGNLKRMFSICNAMQCNAIQCNAMQCNAMQCNAMQCNAMQCNAISNAMQCKVMLYNAIQCNVAFDCNLM